MFTQCETGGKEVGVRVGKDCALGPRGRMRDRSCSNERRVPGKAERIYSKAR